MTPPAQTMVSDPPVVASSSTALPVCEEIVDAQGGCGLAGAPERARSLMLSLVVPSIARWLVGSALAVKGVGLKSANDRDGFSLLFHSANTNGLCLVSSPT